MITRYLKKIPKIPRYLTDRFRWGLLYRLAHLRLRWRSYDYRGLFALLSELTGAEPPVIASYYDELFSKNVLGELRERIRQTPGLEREMSDITYLGMEKYARLDRTVLYCIVRAKKPDVFFETGTRWGMGSYFIARAMEENGKGRLYTFDIGFDVSKSEYFWPTSQSRLGFLVPRRLEKYMTIVEGNALQTLPSVLATVPSVDTYYFDSKQTFDHMIGEYQIVFPRMAPGGLFMSEDTDKNDAWKVFVRDKDFVCERQYCSHYGLNPEREVSALRLR